MFMVFRSCWHNVQGLTSPHLKFKYPRGGQMGPFNHSNTELTVMGAGDSSRHRSRMRCPVCSVDHDWSTREAWLGNPADVCFMPKAEIEGWSGSC